MTTQNKANAGFSARFRTLIKPRDDVQQQAAQDTPASLGNLEAT